MGNGTYPITCTKNGAWPQPFNVVLYASGGDQATDCVDDGSDTTEVTVTAKPTIQAQVVAPDNICDNTTEITFTYNVTIDQLDANGNPLPFTWSINDTATCDQDNGSECVQCKAYQM